MPEKWDIYLQWNVVFFLNVCAFYKDKAKEVERQHRLAELKAKR